MKSMCQDARRNSPSVTVCRPASSCSATTSAIAASSIALSCAASIRPAARSARAVSRCCGRSRLPTWSARKGGVVRMTAIVAGCARPGQLPRASPVPGRFGAGRGREETDMIGGVEHLVASGPLILAVPVALAAGAVTFLSPCCLPLVPGYLSYVTGMSGADASGAGSGGPAAAGLDPDGPDPDGPDAGGPDAGGPGTVRTGPAVG